MPNEASRNPHNVYVIVRTPFANHLVLIPHGTSVLRYQKKVLVGPVEAMLKELAEQEVPLAEIATQYGFEKLAV